MKCNPLLAGQDAVGSHTDKSPPVMEIVFGQYGFAGRVKPLASRFASCAHVAPTRPLTTAAQTLSSAFLQTITAGRLGAVVTVSRQRILQFLDQHLLRSHLLLQNQNSLDQALLA